MSVIPATPVPEKPYFDIVGYSRAGRDHVFGPYCGNGNQDSFGFRSVEKGIIAVTADGCGSRPDSATGSRAAVRIVLNSCEALLAREQIPAPEEFAPLLEVQLLSRIAQAAAPLSVDGDPTSIIDASYLFTLLVAVMTPEWTAVIGCGDGFYSLDGGIEKLPARADNHPEYLAYLLWDPVPEEFQDVHLKVLSQKDTLTVSHLMIGTDGIEPAIKPRGEGADRFQISDLWGRSSFRDAEAVKSVMDGLGEDKDRLDVVQTSSSVTVRQATRRGIFADDTTFIVMTRNSGVSMPALWRDYRMAHQPKPAPSPAPAAGTEPAEEPASKPAAIAADKPPMAPVPKEAPAAPLGGDAKRPAPENRSSWDGFCDWLASVIRLLFGFDNPSEDADTQPKTDHTKSSTTHPRRSSDRRR